jgi:PAS domain S-box-containing protein/putative nucleotidyltransferase with HDIG domain
MRITAAGAYYMKNDEKTKEQLIKELKDLRQQISRTESLEKELRQTNSFLSNIIESSSAISIISTDLDQNIVYWNQGAENIFGYKSGEMVGKHKINKLYAEEESEKRIAEIRSEVFNNRNSLSTEIREVTKDRRCLWINMTLTPRFDENNNLIGILGIGEDITDRKKAEDDRNRSIEKLRKALQGIIHAMEITVETKDPYTAGHQRRTAELATAIAREMKLSEDKIESIHMAGIIHDLGKIAIPGEILSKPGELNDIQISMIKTHPRVGYEILKNIDFPWPIAQIMLEHHERLDGSGYPDGIKGKKINLESKILAVADVVEAIISHRPYRAALGIKSALEEIESNRGKLYDPEAVDTCGKLFKKDGFMFEGYKFE